ncbi:hypothetical protein [Patulibacter minatonensis]|uniref:hypothetical protein n=1 Tax=Patulibacter minatonensis TaxID=298163 RepID=UPI00047CB871|nr:hypothetical protein [Patulibacter minatonensis]
MFGTTTWPTQTTQPHAAPAGGDAGPDRPVLRIRVTRRAACSHRVRREVRLPRVLRADTYVVRVCRPAGGDVLRIARTTGGTPHRAGLAR